MNTVPHIILEARQLGKKFVNHDEHLTILANINLQIYEGGSIAILGVSGAGKSTLLALLAGLDLPTEGDVIFANNNITHLTEDERAQIRLGNMGFIFQSFYLLPHLTALENVMLPLELMKSPDALSSAQQWLHKLGLQHRMQHFPNQLSGGEQQRVAIARAFASQPKLLFADEPTGNLDAVTGDNIIEQLFKLNHELSTTLVLVTHDENLAKHCQQRYELTNGHLTCIG